MQSWFTYLRLAISLCLLGATVSACNTTKATVDSTVKFSSSTSPDSLYTRDGMVAESEKVNLYTAIVLENLQQDMARGQGEYLSSLGVLLHIPQADRSQWTDSMQRRYAALFASPQATRAETVATVTEKLRD